MLNSTKLVEELIEYGYDEYNPFKTNTIFNKLLIKKLFAYKRRKDFLQFLVILGYMPINGSCLSNNNHKIFEVENLCKYIAKFM